MDLVTLISLIVATFVYAISPGPGLFAVLAVSTRFGPIPAVWLSLGHTIGDIIYVSLAMLALNALAEVINNSMLYVKILGASYLIFIGYQQFRSRGVSFEQSTKKSSILKLLIAGFIVGVTNPKTIIFYLSFLPIFVDLNNLTITIENIFEEGHEVLPTGGHIPTTMIKTIYFEQDGNCRKFVFPNQKPTKPWTEYEVTCTN